MGDFKSRIWYLKIQKFYISPVKTVFPRKYRFFDPSFITSPRRRVPSDDGDNYKDLIDLAGKLVISLLSDNFDQTDGRGRTNSQKASSERQNRNNDLTQDISEVATQVWNMSRRENKTIVNINGHHCKVNNLITLKGSFIL